MKKKILCTGHQGFIGSALFSALLKEYKTEAIGLDLKTGQDLITCPLPDKIDVIYHLAAQAFVEPSWRYPVFTLLNLQMTARLVEKYPLAKIVFANTSAAKTSSPYAFSKHVSAEYLKSFHNNYVNITLPNVYGQGSGRVVDIFKNQKKVTIFGDGRQVRDYVYIDDIVVGLLKAKDWPTGDYSMGSGKGTTLLELARGKEINFAPARREDRECVVPNTTPDWRYKQEVMEYLYDN